MSDETKLAPWQAGIFEALMRSGAGRPTYRGYDPGRGGKAVAAAFATEAMLQRGRSVVVLQPDGHAVKIRRAPFGRATVDVYETLKTGGK